MGRIFSVFSSFGKSNQFFMPSSHSLFLALFFSKFVVYACTGMPSILMHSCDILFHYVSILLVQYVTACDVLSVFKRLYNKHTCRGVSGRTEGSWPFPELTERTPEVRPIPDSPNLQVCFVFITCHFGKMLKSTEEFTHFSI
jgi:hypothetical protein